MFSTTQGFDWNFMNKFFELIGKVLGALVGVIVAIFKGIFFVVKQAKEGFDRGRN